MFKALGPSLHFYHSQRGNGSHLHDTEHQTQGGEVQNGGARKQTEGGWKGSEEKVELLVLPPAFCWCER